MKTTLISSLLFIGITATVTAFADGREDYAGLPIDDETFNAEEVVNENHAGYDGLPVTRQVETERWVEVDGQSDYSGQAIMRRQSVIEFAHIESKQ